VVGDISQPQCHKYTKKQKNIMKEKEERHLWHYGWPISQCHQPQCHPKDYPTKHTLTLALSVLPFSLKHFPIYITQLTLDFLKSQAQKQQSLYFIITNTYIQFQLSLSKSFPTLTNTDIYMQLTTLSLPLPPTCRYRIQRALIGCQFVTRRCD